VEPEFPELEDEVVVVLEDDELADGVCEGCCSVVAVVEAVVLP